ncbi:hypothetical protein MKW98_026076 [Papaver atlanticum]|uniref:Neprosin PEP catalytic domain-containing protein n=1 Tax=Papaver atlanticum TaxID=357466 RepID=A0AAD4RY09_9MAGN|nr:hypothetical protein MKW98_026076 [Papaver atlanticum]
MSKVINFARWLLTLTIFIFLILFQDGLIDGRTISNTGIIKTIKVDKDEIIDCYDINKQPSFNHPLLHNHTIQRRPSMHPKKLKLDNLGTLQLTQTWHKYGTCPQGTIPIRRITKDNPSTLLRKHRHPELSHSKASHNTLQSIDIIDVHEYATITMHGIFLGAQAKINLWNPIMEIPSELSVSQIWIAAGNGDDLNTIEAGWEVYQPRYHDSKTRFFILWTSDNYKNKCSNLECYGFVHTSSEIALGCSFYELSTFKGNQKDATFSIHKDQNSGNWWVQVQNIPVGYYPSSLFTQLSNTSTRIDFGGEITNMKFKGQHTTTQMGSGHFPSEGGLGISSYFDHIQIIDENNEAKDPSDVKTYVTNPNCYNLQIEDKHTNGYDFYYGGPGYNDNCR